MSDGLDQLEQARRQRSQRAGRIPPSRKRPRTTPVALNEAAEPATVSSPAETADQPPTSTRAKDTSTAPATPPASKKVKSLPKVSFYQDPDDTSLVRGTILATQVLVPEGPRSMSQFINQAVMAEVKRLQDKYNGGRPFEPVQANDFPKGPTLK